MESNSSAEAQPGPPSAAASDPSALGWMQGAPPPADRQMRWADASYYRFPQLRWSFANFRQFVPTRAVARAAAGPARLPVALRSDLDAVSFTPIGRSETMTWAQSLEANYTDAIVVMHKGRIVYERYFGVMNERQPHIAMSVTKSFVGLLAATLIAEGRIDEAAPVTRYLPELGDTAWRDATVRQVLDMTVGVRYSEDYADPRAEIARYMVAGGMFPRQPGYDGPASFRAFLRTLPKEGGHGDAFAYKTVNTDVMAWIIHRVTGKPFSALLAERIWGPMGAEEDAYLTVDSDGVEFAGGGLNTTVRDLARFGEMMRNGGRFNGRQIVPQAVVDDIRRGGRKEDFAKAGYALLPGWSYRNMWWVSHNAHGAFSARGVHGQLVYVDPRAEMVIARYASAPTAANAHLDPTSLPAYQALAEHLIRRGRR